MWQKQNTVFKLWNHDFSFYDSFTTTEILIKSFLKDAFYFVIVIHFQHFSSSIRLSELSTNICVIFSWSLWIIYFSDLHKYWEFFILYYLLPSAQYQCFLIMQIQNFNNFIKSSPSVVWRRHCSGGRAPCLCRTEFSFGGDFTSFAFCLSFCRLTEQLSAVTHVKMENVFLKEWPWRWLQMILFWV